jgi:hypothetical protein
MGKESNEVRDFVAQVLKGISDGVREAQEHARATDGVPIAVGIVNEQKVELKDSLVEFDLNLAVSKATKASGDAGVDGLIVKLVGAKVEGSGEYARQDGSNHRVKFSVPFYFSASYRKGEQC